MITSAQQSIARQRDALAIFLEAPLMELASVCARDWDDTDALEDALRVGLTALPYCDAIGETGRKARRLPEGATKRNLESLNVDNDVWRFSPPYWSNR